MATATVATVGTERKQRPAIEVDRLTLKDALTLIGRHVSSRTYLPSLQWVKLTAEDVDGGQLTLAATDLEATARVSIFGTLETAGTVLVDRKQLTALVRNGSDRVRVTVDGDTVTVHNGPAVGTLRAEFDEDFPRLPHGAAPMVRIPGPELETFGRVALTASDDEGRPVLTGVKFGPGPDGLELAATDSYGLTVGQVQCEGGNVPDVLVPARQVARIAKWRTDAVDFGAAGGHVHGAAEVTFYGYVTNGPKRTPRGMSVTLTVRTIEGAFPNYRTLMPSAESAEWTVTLDSSALEDGAGAIVSAVPKNQNHAARWNWSFGSSSEPLTVTVDGQTVSVVILHTLQGVPAPFAANPRFLVRAAQASGPGQLTLTFRDSLKPVRIDSADGRTVSLLMPMRVS
jgi:DNA polymerase III subunit beta